MTDTVLRIENLTTQIGHGRDTVTPVSDLTMEIRAGETFALLGESGCGKSMTALSIMRLLPGSGRIESGSVRLLGNELLDISESAMRGHRGGEVGMIFQEPMTSLNPVMTIGRQIGEAVRLHDPDNRDAPGKRILELLKLVRIPDPERRINEYPHQLSGGMKQRVMIAMALAGRPKLLIADEPTTALDVTIQAQVLQLMKDLQRKTGMAILLITHDLGVVAEVADRVGVMYAGQLIETAGVKRFFDTPRHPYSQRLFHALPTPGKRDHALIAISGQVPSLKKRFRGCRFANRCPLATDVCNSQLPPWQGDADHGYLCHFEEPRLAADMSQKHPVEADGGARKLLDVEGLKIHFPIRKGIFRRTCGHVYAVDGVDLSIERGRTLALVGESGCGKTTVGKGILQLIRPTAGKVLFGGDDLTSLKGEALRKKRGDMQIIFQDPASSMNPRMTIEEIVAEGLVAQGLEKNRETRQARITEILQQVGLPEDALGRYPHEFSGGQRQRIAIARALVLKPDLIICDEPTSALDVSVQAQILNLLRQLQHELGLSYLFITHNIGVVSYVSHDLAVMYLGRIVEQGSADAVLNDPQHPYTRALLSAVPVADPDSGREVIRLEGDMPSPSAPPPGCHFHPRCPQAMDVCRQAYPEESRLPDGRRIRCHLVAGNGGG
jgi:peptide/nickel transport system ATP-binding protein